MIDFDVLDVACSVYSLSPRSSTSFKYKTNRSCVEASQSICRAYGEARAATTSTFKERLLHKLYWRVNPFFEAMMQHKGIEAAEYLGDNSCGRHPGEVPRYDNAMFVAIKDMKKMKDLKDLRSGDRENSALPKSNWNLFVQRVSPTGRKIRAREVGLMKSMMARGVSALCTEDGEFRSMDSRCDETKTAMCLAYRQAMPLPRTPEETYRDFLLKLRKHGKGKGLDWKLSLREECGVDPIPREVALTLNQLNVRWDFMLFPMTLETASTEYRKVFDEDMCPPSLTTTTK